MRSLSTHQTLLFGLMLCLIGTPAATSQTRVALADDSRLWIDGSSSVNTFTCTAGTVEGSGVFHASRPSDTLPAEVEVRVPVRRFDCGKARMNSDLYDALRAEAHAHIRFRLDEAAWTAPTAEDDAYDLHITGRLTIAGTERPVALTAQGRQRPDGAYGATGSLPLRMSDFGIDPPSALFGLIKAHDDITVRFDLVATPQPVVLTTEQN